MQPRLKRQCTAACSRCGAPTMQPLNDLVAHCGLACSSSAGQQRWLAAAAAAAGWHMFGSVACAPDAVPPATPMKKGSFLRDGARAGVRHGIAGWQALASPAPPTCGCRRQ